MTDRAATVTPAWFRMRTWTWPANTSASPLTRTLPVSVLPIWGFQTVMAGSTERKSARVIGWGTAIPASRDTVRPLTRSTTRSTVPNCVSVYVSCASRIHTAAGVAEAAYSALRSTVAVPLAMPSALRADPAGTAVATPAPDSAVVGPESIACRAARAGAAVAGCSRLDSQSLPPRWNHTW